jgi:4-carboxymuconolactone decarboxylase
VSTSVVHHRPTAPRLVPVTEAAGSLGETLAKTALDDAGRPLAIFGALAHHEQVLGRFNSFGALLRHSSVTALADRELLVLRVAYRTDCTFEFDQHEPLARAAGLAADAIEAARSEHPLHPDPRWVVLLRFADEIVDDDSVSDATWASASQRWGPEQLIELVATVTFFRMAAGLINTLGIRTRDTWA